MPDRRPIGVMDSGMGGISVLRSLISHMPNEHFIYIGDNKHAPYGEKGVDEIARLTKNVVDSLLSRDIKALVIACNTATSATAKQLRAELDIPILGLEPALKPAAEYAGDGLVAVLATEATLKLEKYRKLAAQYGKNAVDIPCPELVKLVETGDVSSEKVTSYIADQLAPYRAQGIKAVVLGCTHFVWLRDAVHRVIPEAEIFDGNEGLSRHMRTLLGERDLLSDADKGECELYTTSDDPDMFRLMKHFLDS